MFIYIFFIKMRQQCLGSLVQNLIPLVVGMNKRHTLYVIRG